MVEIRILGPLEARIDGREVNLGGTRPQTVLVVLALEAGRVVTVESLVKAVWMEDPPSSARSQIAIHVSALRRAFGDPRVIETLSGGYRIPAGVMRIDVHEAERLIRSGKADDLQQALAMWRGPVLPGIDIEGKSALEELRLTALDAWAQLELGQGRHRELIAPLSGLVSEHPLRERSRGHLMQALWRSGRQADALTVYREGRHLLKSELGVEPGPELKQIEQAILTEDPPPPAERPQRKAIPNELPPDVGAFTGRDDDVKRLSTALTTGAGPVVVISGAGGIGKSALAVHLAHRVAGGFPDGHLYINLHGATPGLQPRDPRDVLGRCLRALGVDDELMPKDVGEAAARFRSLTAGMRLLVVLDNAADVAQVRPLLPGGTAGACLITSRQSLPTLGGATHVNLNGLTGRESVALLARFAGTERVTVEPEAASDIARLCGYLPLALRIAGARLAARPDLRLAMLAERLQDAKHRLDELQYDDLAVRASLAVGHPGEGNRLFALLGRFEVPDLTAPVAAALAGCTIEEAEDALDHLLDAQLVESRTAGRYRMHDLVRLFAREQAQMDPVSLGRALHCYLATARSATLLLDPATERRTQIGARPGHRGIPLADRREAAAWLDGERENLLAVVRLAAGGGIPTDSGMGVPLTEPLPDGPAITVGLAVALGTPFTMRGWWKELISINRVALQCVRQVGDREWEAQIYNDLVTPLLCVGRVDEALAHLDKALLALEEAGDTAGKASVLGSLGRAQGVRKRFDDAVAALRSSVTLKRELGDRPGEAKALTNLGVVLQNLDRADDALAAHEESLAIYRGIGDARGSGIALSNAAETHRLADRTRQAVITFDHAVRLLRDSGDRYSEAVAMWGLGRALHDEGHRDRARHQWRGALTILESIGALAEGQAESIMAAEVPDPPEQIRVPI